MSNTTRKTKPAMITKTDAMRIVDAFNNKGYACVEGTRGLELSIHMTSGLDYAICRIGGLSFHTNKVFETRIEEDSGRLFIYGREIIDVPIKGLYEEALKRNASMIEADWMHAIADYNMHMTPAFRQKLANLVFTLRETCDVAYHVGYTDDGHASGISSMPVETDFILWDAMRQLANGMDFTTVNERVRGSSYNLGRHAGIRDGNITVSNWMVRTISKGVIVSSDRFPRLDDARRYAMKNIDTMVDTDTTVQVLIIPVLPDGTLGGVWETFHPGQN